jgi:hypothetical protein
MRHAGAELILGNLVTKSYGRKTGSGWWFENEDFM